MGSFPETYIDPTFLTDNGDRLFANSLAQVIIEQMWLKIRESALILLL